MSGDAVRYEEAREALAGVLSPGSLEHCERVASECARIAAVYGVDEDAARLAGLLHDWARDADDPDLLAAAQRLGIEVCDADRRRPYLLHARVAAAEIERRFPGIAPDVADAVETHTLGALGMGPLAKVVYVADMTEPARMWHGVEELRAAVGEEDLDELFARAMAATLKQVIDRRKALHPTAIAVWNEAVGR